MGGTCGARCLTSAVTWTCLHCRRTNRCVLHGGFVSKLDGARKNTWPLGVDNTPAFSAPGHRSVARHSRCAQQSVPTRTQISAISNKIFWAPAMACHPCNSVGSGMVRCLHITKELHCRAPPVAHASTYTCPHRAHHACHCRHRRHRTAARRAGRCGAFTGIRPRRGTIFRSVSTLSPTTTPLPTPLNLHVAHPSVLARRGNVLACRR